MRKKVIMVITVCLVMLASMLTGCSAAADKESVTGNVRSESYISGLQYQESAEVSAQYKQAFELARLRLDEAIEENGGTGEGLCIVTDIDDTLIDDSAYLAGVLLSKEEREKEGLPPWNNSDWAGYYAAIATEAVQPVAGAQDFISYAQSKGVKVFYITNRPYYELDLTVNQLKKYGFIDEATYEAYSGLDELMESIEYDDMDALDDFKDRVDNDGRFVIDDGYFTLKDDYTIQVKGLAFSSDKAERRSNVAKCMGENERIVLYMGDSINDMISNDESKYTDYENTTSFDGTNGNAARKQAVMDEQWKDKWGTEFIIMPNATYGDWQYATWYDQIVDDSGEIEAIEDQFNENSYLNSETWYSGPSPLY